MAGLGESKLALQLYNDAIDILEKDYEGNKISLGQLYFGRGIVWKKLNEYNKALSDFEKAVELDKFNASAYAERGFIYFDKGELEAANRDFDQAIKLSPVSKASFFYTHIANHYKDIGRPDLAIPAFNKAIETDPHYALAYLHRANFYRNSNSLKQALQDYTQAINLDESLTEAYFNRGAIQILSNPEQAIKDLSKSIEADSGPLLSYLHNITPYIRSDNLEEAIQEKNLVIQLEAKQENFYTGRGVIFFMSGDIERAILDFNRAIELTPKYAIPYLLRGYAYEITGNIDQANQDFKRYEELVINAQDGEMFKNAVQQLKARLMELESH